VATALPTVASTYAVAVSLDGVPLASSGSHSLAVSSGTLDPAQFTAAASLPTSAVACTPITASVVPRDAYGNAATSCNGELAGAFAITATGPESLHGAAECGLRGGNVVVLLTLQFYQAGTYAIQV